MCSLIDILHWKKNQKDSDDFWHRKLTLKVKFWYFLTAPHYSNFQILVISFEYSWFLAKNLSNFVSLPWKLHNRKCHNEQRLYNFCLTNLSLRAKSNKTDAKLFTSKLTILQIQIPALTLIGMREGTFHSCPF